MLIARFIQIPLVYEFTDSSLFLTKLLQLTTFFEYFL